MAESNRSKCCCCGPCEEGTPEESGPSGRAETRWITGSLPTPAGEIPQVSTRLQAADHLGAWKARWGIGRMRYQVAPGLYAAGNPTSDSPVLVSANYKMSFDRLRSKLAGIDAWIMVLDTDGINVWCAAGKGTFGTDEIVARIDRTKLKDVVSHRTLILPQLGAPGVAAHEVKQRSGFRVVYGPIRAGDLPSFLASGMKATALMRRVQFGLIDRLAVVPIELVMSARLALMIAACFLFLAGLGTDGYSWARVGSRGVPAAALFLLACGGSTILTPALLPWLPGRMFTVKGTWVGLALLLGVLCYDWYNPGTIDNRLGIAAWCLLIPTVAGFMAMNFTGASTYTSLSGVRREMRLVVPIQAFCAVVGVALWIAGRFV